MVGKEVERTANLQKLWRMSCRVFCSKSVASKAEGVLKGAEQLSVAEVSVQLSTGYPQELQMKFGLLRTDRFNRLI